MSSFTISKLEVVVLFDLMEALTIPVSIKDLPQVDELEYKHIVDSFSENHLIYKANDTFKLDKGLEKFLLPVVTAEKIMLFNFGVDGTCSFNASLYFAKRGLVSILDIGDDTIKFLTIDSVDNLLLFIPDVNEDVTTAEGTQSYVSYILFDKTSSVIHCTRIDTEKKLARIVEGKRTPNSAPLESASEAEVSEYKKMLHDKLKELFDVVSC